MDSNARKSFMANYQGKSNKFRSRETWGWIRNDLKNETEGLIFAVQEQDKSSEQAK